MTMSCWRIEFWSSWSLIWPLVRESSARWQIALDNCFPTRGWKTGGPPTMKFPSCNSLNKADYWKITIHRFLYLLYKFILYPLFRVIFTLFFRFYNLYSTWCISWLDVVYVTAFDLLHINRLYCQHIFALK